MIKFNSQLKEISEKLLNSSDDLVAKRYNADDNFYSKEIDESLRGWRSNLVEIFALSIYKEKKDTYNQLEIWGSDAVDLLINLKLPLDVAIEEVRFYRNLVGEIIRDEAVKNNFSLEVFYEIISRFDSIVDRAIYWLSLSYSGKYLSRIQAAEILSLELSVPLIRISSKMAILPLIGDIDTNRAKHLMDKTLLQGSKMDLTYLIIDLSGVPVVDTMVANQIISLIKALKLLGIQTLLSGIRPEIAQTIVKLGINLKDIPTFGNLEQALQQIK